MDIKEYIKVISHEYESTDEIKINNIIHFHQPTLCGYIDSTQRPKLLIWGGGALILKLWQRASQILQPHIQFIFSCRGSREDDFLTFQMHLQYVTILALAQDPNLDLGPIVNYVYQGENLLSCQNLCLNALYIIYTIKNVMI